MQVQMLPDTEQNDHMHEKMEPQMHVHHQELHHFYKAAVKIAVIVETMITKTFTITFKCFFKVQAISYIIYSFELVLTFLEISSVVRYSLYANLCDQHD